MSGERFFLYGSASLQRASYRKITNPSEEKHVCESLRHGVTAHNWFAHYLWDIYKGFGHNGKII